MYNNTSPMRHQVIQAPPNKSVSPVSKFQVMGNLQPPPGMKTVLKPKIYEVVEVPLNHYTSVPTFQPPQQLQYDQELQRKIRQLEQESFICRQKIEQDQKNDKFQQLNEKIRQQQQEIERLKSTNDPNLRLLKEQCDYYFNQSQQAELEKNELILRLKQNEQQMQKIQQQQFHNNDKDTKYNQLLNEYEQLKQKYQILETQSQQQIDQQKSEYDRIYNQHFSQIKQNSEIRSKQFDDQIMKLQEELDNAINEAEVWRQKYHKEELNQMNHTKRINELELNSFHQIKEIERLQQLIAIKQQENDSLQQKINYLEFNYQQISSQGLDSEIKRLKEQLDSRQREIDDLKRRNNEIEQNVLKLKDHEIQMEIIKQRNQLFESQLQESDRFKHQYASQLIELDELRNKQNRLENCVNDLRRNEYRQQAEINRLNDLVRVKDEEINKVQIEYKKNMAQLTQQMNSFRSLFERDIDTQNLNRNRQDMENKEMIDQRIQQLCEELNMIKKDREQLQMACSQLTQTKLGLENRIIVLQGEIDRLNQLVKTQNNEINHHLQTLELQNDQIEQFRQQNEIYKKEMDLFKTNSNSNFFLSGSQKKFDFIPNQHSDSNWN
ncbi:unnamed protein product (macronuclear) [Paramecium tetraurelia]|uniref:Uncharacterized protein n=1 Tax=Paramecium tetraurelia TaxID=5888 RepID=A0BZW6_PARTE|nr:uncharacterized protein GSPATT00005935001 [Paramecium tetraurelia]CAK64083.1 unnamed protein product [Paramecium tetraurelia]|eukprot:XP_001431481.1 hypothetical protein (macronuclear) [Paramecium tetraurelia strain d4-2]